MAAAGYMTSPQVCQPMVTPRRALARVVTVALLRRAGDSPPWRDAKRAIGIPRCGYVNICSSSVGQMQPVGSVRPLVSWRANHMWSPGSQRSTWRAGFNPRRAGSGGFGAGQTGQVQRMGRCAGCSVRFKAIQVPRQVCEALVAFAAPLRESPLAACAAR